MKGLLHKFANTGGLLSISGGATVIAATILLNEPIDLSLPVIATLLVFSAYHLNHIVEIKADIISHPKRALMIKENKILDWIAVLSLILLLLLSYLTSTKPLQTVGIISFMLVMVVLYSVNWFPKTANKKRVFGRLKEIPLFKDVITATVWGMGAILVVVYYGLSITTLTIFTFSIIFQRLLINTMTFDMRDIHADKIFKVRTIPIMFGLKRTKIILYGLNTLFGLFIIVSTYFGYLPFYANMLNFVTLYGYYFISKSTGKNIHFLYDVIIDGEPVLWPILLICGKIIFGV